jgi:hypothetical protein
MGKQASTMWKRLRRSLAACPARFAGGSAVSDPLGLLAVERERRARRPLDTPPVPGVGGSVTCGP